MYAPSRYCQGPSSSHLSCRWVQKLQPPAQSTTISRNLGCPSSNIPIGGDHWPLSRVRCCDGGGTPGTMIYLCSYEIAKDRLSHYVSTDNEFVIHFSAGMIAETLACIIYVPVDVVKERMQIQHKDQHSQHGMGYRNSWDALRKIAATEGTAGVYKGYAATLGSFGPFSALYFMLYEQFKYWTRLRLTDRKESSMRQLDGIDIPFPWLIACSSTAGALASWITSPLDMAKLRLQVQRGQAWGQQPSSSAAVTTYTGVFDCLKKAMATDGLPGLFRGAGARVIFTVPITTVTMTSYETCRSFISKILPNHSHN